MSPRARLPLSLVVLLAVALVVLAFAGLMAVKTYPYLGFEKGIDFLTTKSDETNDHPVFRLGFYVHITTSLVVLLAGLLNFLPFVAAQGALQHRRLGKAYIIGILALAAPSGLILAYFANGGLVSQVGFTLQCLVWWLATWMAYRAARERQWPLHVDWMLRSYAVTLAALALRGESYFMSEYLGTKPIETYLTVTWLSWVGNVILMEILLGMGVGRYFLRQFSGKLIGKLAG